MVVVSNLNLVAGPNETFLIKSFNVATIDDCDNRLSRRGTRWYLIASLVDMPKKPGSARLALTEVANIAASELIG